MANYWIKLYHQILYDPKMGTLPDRVWRRAIELFLLAGETGKGGELPDIDHIAWALRVDKGQLQDDFTKLLDVGILTAEGDDLVVANFSKRQSPLSPAEYMRKKREKEKIEEYKNPRDDGAMAFNSRNGDDPVSDLNGSATDPVSKRNDTFDDMVELLETTIGLLPTPADIPGIQDLVKAGATEGDIRAALRWRSENARPAVKTISQLIPGIMANRNKRIQKAGGKLERKGSDYAASVAKYQLDDDQPLETVPEVKREVDPAMEKIESLYDLFLSYLTPGVRYKLELEKVYPLWVDPEGVLIFSVPNLAVKDYIDSNLKSTLERHFIMPIDYEIEQE